MLNPSCKRHSPGGPERVRLEAADPRQQRFRTPRSATRSGTHACENPAFPVIDLVRQVGHAQRAEDTQAFPPTRGEMAAVGTPLNLLDGPSAGRFSRRSNVAGSQMTILLVGGWHALSPRSAWQGTRRGLNG